MLANVRGGNYYTYFFMSLKPLNMLQHWRIQYSWSSRAKGIYLIYLLKCTETELVFLLRNCFQNVETSLNETNILITTTRWIKSYTEILMPPFG